MIRWRERTARVSRTVHQFHLNQFWWKYQNRTSDKGWAKLTGQNTREIRHLWQWLNWWLHRCYRWRFTLLTSSKRISLRSIAPSNLSVFRDLNQRRTLIFFRSESHSEACVIRSDHIVLQRHGLHALKLNKLMTYRKLKGCQLKVFVFFVGWWINRIKRSRIQRKKRHKLVLIL